MITDVILAAPAGVPDEAVLNTFFAMCWKKSVKPIQVQFGVLIVENDKDKRRIELKIIKAIIKKGEIGYGGQKTRITFT